VAGSLEVTRGAADLSAEQVAGIRDLLRRSTGVALSADKDYLVRSRLSRLAGRQGVSLEELAAELPRSQVARARAVEALLNHETSFFRDWRPFEALRESILPRLFAATPPGRELVLWSAACASGQEPYSLAMLLEQHFPGERDRVRIVASDVSNEALARARAGLFSQAEINRGLPSRCLLGYFERRGLRWEISPKLRERIEFRRLNLLSDPYPADVHVLLLRNVLLYFEDRDAEHVLERAEGALAPGGALLLGGAEACRALPPVWERELAGRVTVLRSRRG